MKTFRVLSILFLSFFSIEVFAQAPPKIWDKRFGGLSYDYQTCMLPLPDGNFLSGGSSSSNIGGDKTQNSKGGADYWVVKIDPNGNKIWDKTFGGSSNDYMFDMALRSNGTVILSGHSYSPASGDKSQNSYGGIDIWVVEIDQNGNKIWDKDYGGTSSDYVMKAVENSQHQLFFVGSSNSVAGGSKTSPAYGSDDIWVVKTDTAGNSIGDYSIGGSSSDYGRCVDLLPDGNIVIGSATMSGISGNITSASYGSMDYLIIKMDVNGGIVWQRRFGGTADDGIQYIFDYNFKNIIAVKSVGQKIAVCSWSRSGVSGNKTMPLYASDSDYWLIMLDANGSIAFQKQIGGNALDDDLTDMFVDNQKNILISCTSYSNASFDKTQNNMGYESTWVIRVDTLGTISWDRTVLETSHAEVSLVCQLENGSFVMGNSSTAGIGGDKTQNTQGGNDYFMICLAAAAAPDANISATNQSVCVGTCTNISYTGSLYPVGTITWSFPGGTPTTATGYTVNVCYSTPGYYPVQVIATNALGADTMLLPNYIYVLQLANPVLSYSGGVLLCNTGVTAVTFQWLLNGVNIPGATDSTFTPMIDGIYSVVVNPGSICPQTLNYTVNNLPAYIQSMNANMNYLCPNNCIQFSATTFNSPTTYQWFFQGASPPTSTQAAPSNICYPTPGTYDVTLIIHNAYGNDTLYYPGYIHVLNLTPVIINQNDTLFSNTIGNAYQWYLNNNPIAGATNQYYVPSQPGNYQVLVTSYIGCAAFSNIQIIGSPVASFSLVNNSLCQGQCVQFVSTSSNAPTNYQWTFAGGTPATSTIASPTICFNTTGVFDVQLIVSNQFGTDTIPCTACVTVLAQPAVPTIIQNGALLTSSVTGTYYQWYLNGVQIGGANNQSYTASVNGYYSVEVFGSNGCSSTSGAMTFTLNTLPTAIFTADQTEVCQNFCISFQDLSLNTPSNWQWSFPGGSPVTSSFQNPLVCYYVDGTYDVTLITHNAFGYDTLVMPGYITVYGIPQSTITYANDTLFAPSGAYAYQWLFNGSNIPGAISEFYVPGASGAYNVIVYNQYGCAGTNIQSYLFNPAPLSSFMASGTQICANNCILFTNTTSNSPTSVQWYFTGGTPSSSTLTNPVVCYPAPGNFSVELITTNASGSDTLFQNNLISVQDNPQPVITLVGSTLNCSVLNGGGPFTYQWNINTNNIPGATLSSYTPTSGGVFNVIVTNSNGCTAISNDMTVSVSNAPQINLMSSDSNICAGTCINFTDLSVNFPTMWQWHIVGGSPTYSNQQNPIICFPGPGNFDVTLIASNSFGADTFYFPQMITVQSATPPTVSQSNDTLFASGVGITGYQWYGPSGSISGATNNFFIPDSSGIYNCNATYSNGCGAFNITPYHFYEAPVPHISSSDTVVCTGDCINFFDHSDNNPTNWWWTFNGATPATSSLQNPTSICFNNVGLYTVTLNAGNQTGNSVSTFSSFIQVVATPTPVITFSGTNLVCNYGGAYTFEWYLNGVFIASAGTNTLAPVGPGTYTVVVITNTGCRGTSAGFIYTGIASVDGYQINFSVKDESLFVNGCDQLIDLKIYNTLGQLLFKTDPLNEIICSYPLPFTDTRFYLIEAETMNHIHLHQLILKP